MPRSAETDDRVLAAVAEADAATAAETEAEAGDGYRWVVLTWVVVIAFGLLAVVRSQQVGIPIRDPGGAFFWSRLAINAVLFAVIAFADAAWRLGLRNYSTARTWAQLRRRWTRRRLLLAASAFVAYQTVYLSYHNLKSWDVLNEPRDDMLLRWDRFLFLGHDPATLLHGLLGEHYAAYVLMVIYESFSTLVTIAVVAAVVLPRRMRNAYAFIASAIWVWILGTASYYAIPSLGPFDSAPEVFRGLPPMMIQETQARYMDQRAQLLAHPEWSDSFAQVSAFASLHTGVTTLLLLMAYWFGLRRIGRALIVYLIGTMIATIYLGWHFVLDDVAGLAIAVVAVAIGTRMVYPGGKRPESVRSR